MPGYVYIPVTLCISQFKLRLPPSPRPPPGYCEAFAALVSPGGGAFANFVLPGAGHLPTPRPFLSFCHARGFLSEYNYNDDFTHGKTADWLIRHGQEKLKRL